MENIPSHHETFVFFLNQIKKETETNKEKFPLLRQMQNLLHFSDY
jgi:hypothetical protein